MKHNQTIEQLLRDELKKIQVPSRTEFRSMIDRVTNQADQRNTKQKGSFWPFGTSARFIFFSSAAVLALVMVIVPASHRYGVRSNHPSRSNNIIIDSNASNEDVIESIINDILDEFNDENTFIQQEFSNESTFNDNGDIVDILIS